MTNPIENAQPLLDLSRLLAAVRRRRRVWLSLGLAGLLAGGLLAVFLPTPPTAVTRLLIVHENDQPTDGGSLMRTDIALLETTRIASAALESIGVNESPEEFLKTYEGTGLTSNVLELKVEAATDADALARAKALGDTFIADHKRRIQTAADAQARALNDQRGRAERELAQVDASIAQTPVDASGQTAAELETLYGRRAELASQISELARQAEEAAIGAPGVVAGTQLVDAPRILPNSLLLTGATNSAIGLVLGLAVGLTFAAVSGVVRDRPVLRRDISFALGAPVIAQLPATGARPWRRKRTEREWHRIAAVLARLVRKDAAPTALLELGCANTAATLATRIAAELATTGPVLVVDSLPGGPVREPRAAATGETRSTVRVVGRDELPTTREARVLGVGTVRPATEWTDLPELGRRVLLVVRAGHAPASWLHVVARQLAELGIAVLGVVLVDPDPADHTDGTLWDGLHAALRVAERVPRDGDLPTIRLAPVPINGKGFRRGQLPTQPSRTGNPGPGEAKD